ncbi:Tkp4 protein [Vanderwaltozyma polyspora DSM 70294]|uniref:Tkp4 protein n=1 Tax=Vanderwaltozyma polyspora (strain ATCC 22028 / DSM 70294 / BCRC 21397 / CBS 2163 / NBRC 10782 / NRRL Y-8283 / UCD 57-17) TaxID=436907 RepID=A7TTR5_VANPO|nr:Tkp4 protein [Vanderwaltozyma polyspora DSM 70294]EDO14341.1 Tkp4 protein [Vanderwaltozyma polyspora DSM 70294]
MYRFLKYIKGTNFQFRYIKLFMLYRLLCYKRMSELPLTDLSNRSKCLFNVCLLTLKFKAYTILTNKYIIINWIIYCHRGNCQSLRHDNILCTYNYITYILGHNKLKM